MATDIRDIPEQVGEAAVEGAVMGADLVTGTAATIADAVTKPVKTARGIERKGAPINRAVAKAVANEAEDVAEAIEAVMPERVLMAGISMLKARARRKDIFGVVSYRVLELANDRVEGMTKFLQRFERATEPPARHGEIRRPARAASRRVERSASKTTRRTTKTARTAARRGTARARRTERKSS
jgi:hypothetical protein